MEMGNSSFRLSYCRAECWNDCHCVGYSSHVYSYGCTFWRGKHLNFSQDISGMSAKHYVITEITEPQTKARKEQEIRELLTDIYDIRGDES
ncbi:hypothetical protein HAX54_031770 [Datura stramonium]|uniref:Apple domain-containing protein n=1 Tax=Datura stramonium TaxID=4076 RepID=A0ABS8V9M3_DATST|nr:hypothetical protein [Datura stramonium]